MINQAIEKYNINPDTSVMVGDNITDIQAAQKVNIRTKYLFIEKERQIPSIPTNLDVDIIHDLHNILPA